MSYFVRVCVSVCVIVNLRVWVFIHVFVHSCVCVCVYVYGCLSLTCSKVVNLALSAGGEPLDPGYSQSMSRPSNWYCLRNLITLLMNVWRLAALDTIAVNLGTHTQLRHRVCV